MYFRASYAEVARWVLESFEAVSPICIQNGFRRGLEEDEPIEQNEEFENEDEEEDTLEIPNTQLPEEVIDAMTSLQMFSGDEFNGFD